MTNGLLEAAPLRSMSSAVDAAAPAPTGKSLPEAGTKVSVKTAAALVVLKSKVLMGMILPVV